MLNREQIDQLADDLVRYARSSYMKDPWFTNGLRGVLIVALTEAGVADPALTRLPVDPDPPVGTPGPQPAVTNPQA